MFSQSRRRRLLLVESAFMFKTFKKLGRRYNYPPIPEALGAFSVIVKTDGSFGALASTQSFQMIIAIIKYAVCPSLSARISVSEEYILLSSSSEPRVAES